MTRTILGIFLLFRFDSKRTDTTKTFANLCVTKNHTKNIVFDQKLICNKEIECEKNNKNRYY